MLSHVICPFMTDVMTRRKAVPSIHEVRDNILNHNGLIINALQRNDIDNCRRMRRSVVFFGRRWHQVQNEASASPDPLVTAASQNAHF